MTEDTSLCPHWYSLSSQRLVPAHVFTLHCVHCERFLYKCVECSELMPKALKSSHSHPKCPDCHSSLTKDGLDAHRPRCEFRPRPCEFCSLELPIHQLNEHQEDCSNRTEVCESCQKFVKLKDMIRHLSEDCRLSEDGRKRKRPRSPHKDRKRVKRS
jgi:DNA-directed RNA polymerase subunit RPC12/RpoP